MLCMRERQAGFTLVELVLALVLSGAFLMLITPAIRFAIKQPEQGRLHAEASHKALLVSELVGRDLEFAQMAVIGGDARCIEMSVNTKLQSYCFEPQGLVLQSQGRSSSVLVDGVEGRFLSHGADLSPTKLLDLQVNVARHPDLSFSRLIVLPESEGRQDAFN